MPSSRPQDDAAAQFQGLLDQMRAALFTPGEQVPGWDAGGADPDAATHALGADRFYQLSRSEGSYGVTILTDRPITDFAPERWRVADSYGQPGERLDTPQLDFHPLSERYIMASRVSPWRLNDVRCYRDFSQAILYEDPAAPARPDDEAIPMMFRMMMLAMEGQTICSRMDGDRQSGYRPSYFTPDGRRLPALQTPDMLVTIVPAAPIEQLVRAGPPRPAGD